MYELIVFDLDGTILNTLDDLTDSLNVVFKELGYPKRTIEEVRNFVGNGVLKLIERAVPTNTSEEDVFKAFHRFSKYYQTHCAIKTKPYEGIIEVLQELRKQGCKVAVTSNKIHPAVVSLCHKYFKGLIDIAIGDNQIRPKKPNPDMVEYVLEQLKISKTKTIYVGDSDVDILTAKNTGIDCIVVDWGFRTRDFLIHHEAKKIASNPKELLQLLKKD